MEGEGAYVWKRPRHSYKPLSVCLRTQGCHDIPVVTLWHPEIEYRVKEGGREDGREECGEEG